MRKFYRRIVFSMTPLKSQFQYKDIFQILPVDSASAPSSPYNKHFPLLLEYYIDYDDKQNAKDIDIFDDLSAQQVVEFEILNILSVLSNYRFFRYRNIVSQWAMLVPSTEFQNLNQEQKTYYNNQYSSWTVGGYVYPGLRQELQIEEFTLRKYPEMQLISPYFNYFTDNPVENPKGEITFPETIYSCLDNYFILSSKTLKKIKSLVALACDGMDISSNKRSLAFLSFVSALEALVGLEFLDKEIEFQCNSCKSIKTSPYHCSDCGQPIWGIKTKFKEFLKKFVAGSESSVEKYNKIYNLRCKIAHQGQLFIGDYELSMDNMDKKENDWLMQLETLQLIRLSLTNWLRYTKKASR